MAVDKKISQLASGAPAQAGDEYVVARSGANYKLTLTNIAASMPPIGATTPNTGSFTSLTNSGNLTFSSTGQRITGDFSNATASNRLLFQTSTTNGNSFVGNMPNGTGSYGAYISYNGSDPANSSSFLQGITSTDARLVSTAAGTGSLLPMTFYTGGSERMRLDTSGNLGIGTASPVNKLSVAGGISSTTNTNNADTPAAQFDYDGTGARWFAYKNTGSYQIFYTNSSGGSVTERMRIDSSGNVGIGGAAEAARKVDVLGTLPTAFNFSEAIRMAATIPSGSTSGASCFISFPSTAAASFTCSNLYHFRAVQNTFGAGSTVTNQFGFWAGDNLTGATNNYGFYSNIASGSNRWNFYAAGTANNYFAGTTLFNATATGSYFDGQVNSYKANLPAFCGKGDTQNVYVTTVYNTATSGDNYFTAFVTETSPTLRGSITYNRAGAAVAYNTTSDYRAKDVFGAWDDAGATIDALKVYRGKMHSATLERPMMIAHEAQAVVPYAVSGEKDAVDKDGNPVYQQMDHQVLVPLLIAELQAVRARLAALEAK